MHDKLKEKNISIIGGTGSLGNALVNYLLSNQVQYKSLTIISRDEMKQLDMMAQFPEDTYRMRYFLGDIRDGERMMDVLAGADLVIHAAAIKHVVMAEKNPDECMKTNVLGTKNVLAACKQNNIEKSILVSTDKAEEPVGIYGQSKREAEQLYLDALHSNTSVVRLGNIINSRGSVWHQFKEQSKTGVLKVTHPEATRFHISKEAAAAFVLNQLVNGKKEISSPQMTSFNVLQLAKQLYPECRIEFIGLRPGDKLHEHLNGVSSEHQVQTFK